MAINTVEAIQVGDTSQRIRVRGADTSTRSRPADDQRSDWLIAMGGLLLRLSLGRGIPV